MTERAAQLMQTADTQLSELIDLLSAQDEAAMRLPCPGREKLGDGTVGACASHTADNYLRIAAFLRGEQHAPPRQVAVGPGAHRIPRLLRARGHASASAGHSAPYRADSVDLHDLLERLADARDALSVLAGLTDQQLDTVPPASEMKFCDGQRTLEQIVTSLLGHQSHQLDALRAAVA